MKIRNPVIYKYKYIYNNHGTLLVLATVSKIKTDKNSHNCFSISVAPPTMSSQRVISQSSPKEIVLRCKGKRKKRSRAVKRDDKTRGELVPRRLISRKYQVIDGATG